MTRDKFNEFVLKQSRKLYGFAFRILKNQEEAEDAVQEVFIKLWKMGENIDNYLSIDALATTMTKNYCIDQIRKQKHILNDHNEIVDYQNITSPSPLEQLESMESDEIVQKIIGNLDEKYRIVIELRDIEGLSYEEIADKTGQNINTLRVTISRARGFVREEYKKYNNEKRGIKQVARKIL
jgi:RNA polymerase sigma-70 factor (ECF subfamily)